MNIKLAGCVIENADKKILLLHRNSPERVQWELPGGKLEENELPEDAALREVQEELGVSAEILEELGQKSFKEDGNKMDYFWFKARIVYGTPIPKEVKFDAIYYFSWEELKERTDLSANAQNLVDAYFNKKISL